MGTPIDDVVNRVVGEAWAEYNAATGTETTLYEQAVHDAGILRQQQVSTAVDAYHAAVQVADQLYTETQTIAWKAFHAATTEARTKRNQQLDQVRHNQTPINRCIEADIPEANFYPSDHPHTTKSDEEAFWSDDSGHVITDSDTQEIHHNA